MLECLTKINWKKVGLFASGTLFGTAGIKALASDDAKKALHKLYSSCFKSKRDGYEYSYNCSGERRRYL